MTIAPSLTSLSRSTVVQPVKRLTRWLRGTCPSGSIDPHDANRLAHIVDQYTKELERVVDAIRKDHDEILKP